MSAVPIPDPDLEKNKTIQLLEGELPSRSTAFSGCFPYPLPDCRSGVMPKHVLFWREFQTRRFA